MKQLEKTKLFKGKPSYYIHMVVILLFMFVFKYLPNPEPITEIGMGVLGVFIGWVYGCLTVGIVWPSMIGLIAFGLTGYNAGIGATMISAFGSNNILILIFVMGMLGVLEMAGITEWIALKIMRAKIGNNRPWVMIFLMIAASYVLVAITFAWASVLFVWAIFYKIVEKQKIEKGSYTQYAMFSIMMGSIIGGQVIPFSGPVLNMQSAYTGAGGTLPSLSSHILWMLVVTVVIAILWVLVGKFILKIKPVAIARESIEEAPKLNAYQKIVLAALVLFLICLLSPNWLPKAWTFTTLMKDMSVKGLAFAVLAILLMLNFAQGKRLNEYMTKVNFEMLMMVGLIVTFTGSLSTDTVGIMAWLTQVLSPIFSGLPSIVFIIIILAIPLILTQFLNNQVCAVVFIPIAHSICQTLGISSVVPYIGCILLCCCALASPSGCASAGLMYSNAEWFDTKTAMKYGWIFAAIALVSTLVIGLPLGSLIW